MPFGLLGPAGLLPGGIRRLYPSLYMTDETRVEKSKFELGATPTAKGGPVEVDTGDLPWAYGEDRITAMVRDPDSAYLYWEITDPSIAAARSRLGPAGPEGWCNLRIYDTTGQAFDGTNAHDYFDIRVERSDREHFVMVRRPSSSMHAEIGIKTVEGYFQPIARSGRADFPRSNPSPNTSLEWMSVTSEDAPPSAAAYRSRYAGPEAALPGREGAGYFDVWRAAYAPSMPVEPPAPPQGSPPPATRTAVTPAHVERWWKLDEWRSEHPGALRFAQWMGTTEGQGGVTWREGPFPLALHDPERVAVELLGEPPAHFSAEDAGFTVYGPWRVVIQTFEAEPARRVLATWSMRWVQATTPLIERFAQVVERRIVAGYEREHLVGGASEGRAIAERGASELWRLGASERRWLGASEWALGGASETPWLGASRLALAGASASLLRGASEWLGASGWASAGASEQRPILPAERWGGRLDGKEGR
jgi:hypothetical protein